MACTNKMEKKGGQGEDRERKRKRNREGGGEEKRTGERKDEWGRGCSYPVMIMSVEE